MQHQASMKQQHECNSDKNQNLANTVEENDESASQQERRAPGQKEGALQARGEDVEMAGCEASPRNNQSDAMMRDDTSDQKSKFQFNKNDADMSMHVAAPQTEIKPVVPASGSMDHPKGKCHHTILA